MVRCEGVAINESIRRGGKWKVKIYKVIVDKKPAICFYCPLRNSGVKVEKKDCGKYSQKDIGGGWRQGSTIPDDRCILEEQEEQHEPIQTTFSD